MHQQLARPDQLRDGRQIGERQHLATGGVLQRHQTGTGEVRVVRLDRGGDVLQPQGAVGLVLQRLGLDPALMSNPFVAAISDILAIVIYMSVSLLLLRG